MRGNRKWHHFVYKSKFDYLKQDRTEELREVLINWVVRQQLEFENMDLLTFTFHPIRGRQDSQWEQMKRDIETFYAHFVTRVARYTRSPASVAEFADCQRSTSIAISSLPAFAQAPAHLVGVILRESPGTRWSKG